MVCMKKEIPKNKNFRIVYEEEKSTALVPRQRFMLGREIYRKTKDKVNKDLSDNGAEILSGALYSFLVLVGVGILFICLIVAFSLGIKLVSAINIALGNPLNH